MGAPPPVTPPPPGAGPAAYGPPQPKSSSVKWLAIGCAVAGGMVVVVCAGFLIFGFAVYGRLAPIVAEVNRYVLANPTVLAEMGEVQQLQINQPRSVFKDDAARCVFDLRGSKNTGTVTVNLKKNAEGWKVTDAVLSLDDGRTIPLKPDGKP